MEIQNHTFTRKWRGFDPEEVKHFLYAVSEEYEQHSERNHLLAQELAILRERVKVMEGRDKVLKDTLITAQQIKTDIGTNAEKEAELIIKEAQLKADAIHETARDSANKVRTQMTELRRLRNDMLAEGAMLVSRFNHFVEAEQSAAEEIDKLASFSSPFDDRKKQSALKPVQLEGRRGTRPQSPLEVLSDLTRKKA